MHRIVSVIGIVMSMTVCAVAQAQADDQGVKASHQHASNVKVPRGIFDEQSPQRICDWIGPGGRAVYRCRTIN
jgi:hypothetical protein